ncbi:hypothetical protein K0M31_015105 [Melipona bicolor]|uniref:Uncharacterized protein n=1 Tax=Melipona bicolor TaxID=60889 RepID=A0AA40KFQ2_9HYME|nr:hypothetical protein K0M31_015105 [Melipona bicolor]
MVDVPLYTSPPPSSRIHSLSVGEERASMDGWLAGWLASWLVGLAGWLAGWIDGWMDGWMNE